MTHDDYEAPTIGVVGSIDEMTQVTKKFATHAPDGIEYVTTTGKTIVLTS